MSRVSAHAVNRVMNNPHDVAMIDAFCEHLRRAGRSPRTIALRRKTLLLANDRLAFGLGEAAEDELAAWIYDARHALQTRATYLAGVRTFYQWAVKARWVTIDPTVDLETVSVPRGIARPCSDADLTTILTSAPQPYRVWATIAAYQGLRCIELASLDREHITAERVVVVYGKGNRPRVLDTDPCVWAAVRGLPPGPLAIVAGTGERASNDYVSCMANNAFRDLGVKVTMHQLRHWMGVNMQRAYRNIRVTQQALGHVSLASTQIYTFASDDELRAARATLPRLAG